MKIFQSKKSEQATDFNWDIIGEELQLHGKLTLPTVEKYYKKLESELKSYARKEIRFILKELNQIDSAGIAALQNLQMQLEDNGKIVHWTDLPPKIQKAAETFSLKKLRGWKQPSKISWIEKVGGLVYQFFTVEVRYFIYLMADTMFWTFTDIFNHKHRREGSFINQGALIGANAVPIIGLIAFLIGLVLALQSAAQLRQFGANIFVVDLLAISMTREMGPLLTAIVVAGRSGSAIASEIGTMVVTEEVDALKTMALNPVRFVVVPKIHAMIVSLPLLTILADILGILGGMIISYLYLDISPAIFFQRTIDSIIFRDLVTGFIKSLIFAGLIVVTASYYGFRVKGGAEGVGKITTASVVTSIFLVILADSALGLLFYFE